MTAEEYLKWIDIFDDEMFNGQHKGSIRARRGADGQRIYVIDESLKEHLGQELYDQKQAQLDDFVLMSYEEKVSFLKRGV